MNWLTYLADVEVALATFKRTRQVWAPLNITIGDEYLPGPSVTSYVDTLDFIRNVPCERDMGKSSNSMAVVDSTARVFGVQNLRVVDAIILPTLPPGHPRSTCYMIAEKIAADILAGR